MASPPFNAARAAPAAWIVIAALAGLACEKAPAPESAPPAIAIVWPPPESAVADTVRVRMVATADAAVAAVTLCVDDTTRGSRRDPPWEIDWWTGALADSSYHLLRAEIRDSAGRRAESAPHRVCVRRNAPPRVRIAWPSESCWIDLDAAARPWTCSADDPDEGALSGERIHWYLDGVALPQNGLSIEPPSCAEGAHTIMVRAVDIWGRWASARRTIQAFRYPRSDDARGALEVFLCALRARDAAVAGGCLAEEFRFFAPGHDPAAPGWRAEAERNALARLLDDDALLRLEVRGTPGPAESFAWHGRPVAKIEIRGLSLQATVACAAPAAGDSSREAAWEVRDSHARVYFAEDAGGDARRWTLLAWWDLHGALGCGSARPSWGQLKEAVLEDRLCR